MNLDVCVDRVIAAPPEKIAEYAMDWRTHPEWSACIRSVELTMPGPDGVFGVGSEITRAAQFLGKTFEYVLRVVGYDPPTELDMKSVAGPMKLRYTYRFEEHPDGTRTSIRVRADAGRFYRLSMPLLTAQLRSTLRGDLLGLSQFMTRA
ncbi:MAG: hypothetical protein QOI35_3671 [Cryptosporangiaceae bacterium]|nr:hypothetical protein [Cryptosporangiaceae bacterium]